MRSIRLKLIGFFLLPVMGILIFIGSYLAFTRSERSIEEIKEKGRILTEMLAIASFTPLANNDKQTVDDLVTKLSQQIESDLNMQYLMILDYRGKIFAHNQPDQYGRMVQSPSLKKMISDETVVDKSQISITGSELLEIIKPISFFGKRWGFVVLGLSLDIVRLEARQYLIRWVLLTLLGVALVTLLLYLALSRIVIRRIRLLAQSMDRFRAGNLQERSGLRGADEMGQLGILFDKMAEELQTYTTRLEHLVAEKTEALRIANEELERLAVTDGLTGIHNHRFFKERLDEEIRRAERNKGRFALILMDLDNFKRFNDTHGHLAGDSLLKMLASLIRGKVRSSDVVARYGGEEFVVLVLDTDVEAAAKKAEELRHLIASEQFPNSKPGDVTISLGVSGYPRHGSTANEIIHTADTALYKAKGQGKNQVCVASVTVSSTTIDEKGKGGSGS